MGAVSNDSEMSIHTICLKIRAFLYTAVFVNMDQTEWFDLAAAEALIDRMMNFLHHRHSAGTPSDLLLYGRVGVRSPGFPVGNPLGKDLEGTGVAGEHLPALLVPVRPRHEQDCTGSGQKKKDRAHNEGVKFAQIERTKDREIVSLKRQLSEVKTKPPRTAANLLAVQPFDKDSPIYELGRDSRQTACFQLLAQIMWVRPLCRCLRTACT